MENRIYVIVDDDGNVIKASEDYEELEALCEEHAYKMRQRAIEELGQDDDGDEKDLIDAEIYAGQNFPIWSVGWVSKDACDKADGEDVTVYSHAFGDVEVSSSEILDLFK